MYQPLRGNRGIRGVGNGNASPMLGIAGGGTGEGWDGEDGSGRDLEKMVYWDIRDNTPIIP